MIITVLMTVSGNIIIIDIDIIMIILTVCYCWWKEKYIVIDDTVFDMLRCYG